MQSICARDHGWGPEVSISCTLRNLWFRRALWSGQFWVLGLIFHSEVPFRGQYIPFGTHRSFCWITLMNQSLVQQMMLFFIEQKTNSVSLISLQKEWLELVIFCESKTQIPERIHLFFWNESNSATVVSFPNESLWVRFFLNHSRTTVVRFLLERVKSVLLVNQTLNF